MSDALFSFGLPSKGELDEPTTRLLQECGLSVSRPNPRQYEGTLPAVPGVRVLLQRPHDIALKVADGTLDAGITGLDILREECRESEDALVLIEDLGYARCSLVLGVPESWVDVESLADLAELAAGRKEQGRDLRIATKFPNLTWQFLHDHGVHYFSLVAATGALELAPAMGTADLIADIVSSGVTLRDNRLKQIRGGRILKAQACLIGNAANLQAREKLARMRQILEPMEARLRARGYLAIRANVAGETAEAVGRAVLAVPELAGLRGPTVSPVFARERGASLFAVSLVAPKEALLRTVEHLRAIGAAGVSVTPVEYVFEEECRSYERLVATLRHRRA